MFQSIPEESIHIRMASEKNDNPEIISNEDGIVDIDDELKEEFLNELYARYREYIPGSSDDIQSGDSNVTTESSSVIADGFGLTRGIAGAPGSFTIYRKESRGDDLSVSVEGSFVAEIKCHNNQDDTVSVSYLPTASGEFVIRAKYFEKHIAGSPFKARVTGSPFRVYDDIQENKDIRMASGIGLSRGITGEPARFKIFKKGNGGYGLTVGVDGPSVAEIKCCENFVENTVSVEYLPTAPGDYTIFVVFIGQRIKTCFFRARITGNKPSGVNAYVQSPSGAVEDAPVSDLGNFLYRVVFVPQELGVHAVSIQCLNKYMTYIRGSPFLFTVGGFRYHGAQRVHASGPGLAGGYTNEPCEFYVWTREAGAGNLEIYVQGYSNANIQFRGRRDDSCCISYEVSEPGNYRIGLTFNSKHIPYSPFDVLILPQYVDAQTLTFIKQYAPS